MARHLEKVTALGKRSLNITAVSSGLSPQLSQAQAQFGVMLVQTKHSENRREQFCRSKWDRAGMVTLGLGLSYFSTLSAYRQKGENTYQLLNKDSTVIVLLLR